MKGRSVENRVTPIRIETTPSISARTRSRFVVFFFVSKTRSAKLAWCMECIRDARAYSQQAVIAQHEEILVAQIAHEARFLGSLSATLRLIWIASPARSVRNQQITRRNLIKARAERPQRGAADHEVTLRSPRRTGAIACSMRRVHWG
jgi:hypothetical protein